MSCSLNNYLNKRAVLCFAVFLGFLGRPMEGFAAPPAKDDSLPPSEQKFCNAVVKYSEICRQAEDSGANAINLESIRKDLTTALRKAAGPRDTTLKGWIGKVVSIGTSSSGRGTLDIELPCHTVLSTSSSEDSDSMDAAGPLDPSNRAFAAAAQLKEGQETAFSGKFLSDWGYAYNELGSGNTCHGDAFVLLFQFSGLGPPEARRAAVRGLQPKTAPIAKPHPVAEDYDDAETSDARTKGPAEGGPVTASKASDGKGYPVGPGEGSVGILRDPEFLSYYKTVQEQIKNAWSFTGGSNDLSATVDFTIGPDGTLTALKIGASSNDSAFDDSVVSAIRRAAPFPAPPEKFRNLFSVGIKALFQLGELKS